MATQDDTAVPNWAYSNVDYLSQDWSNTEVSRSWSLVVSRRVVTTERRRLENAAWRAWGKSLSGLGVVAPEKLGWSKDSDVTYLYGPAQGYDAAILSRTVTSAAIDSRSIMKITSASNRPLRNSHALPAFLNSKDVTQGAAPENRFEGPQSNPPQKQHVSFNAKVKQHIILGGAARRRFCRGVQPEGTVPYPTGIIALPDGALQDGQYSDPLRKFVTVPISLPRVSRFKEGSQPPVELDAAVSGREGSEGQKNTMLKKTLQMSFFTRYIRLWAIWVVDQTKQ